MGRKIKVIKPDTKWNGKEPLSIDHIPQVVTLMYSKKWLRKQQETK